MAERASSSSTYLLVPIVLIALLLSTAVIRGPNLVSLSGFGSAIIVAAPLILATYALMALAVAGRGTVDLAMGPLVAFINVSVVKLNMLGVISGPFGTFLVALGWVCCTSWPLRSSSSGCGCNRSLWRCQAFWRSPAST